MSANPIQIPVNPLSRDLDVTVTITRPQTELASDLSLLCFATPNVGFPPDNDRVRQYYTFDGLIEDTGWGPDDTGYWAAKAFFDQADRPAKMAVGRIFTAPVPAQLQSGPITTPLAALAAVTAGSFKLTLVDGSGTAAEAVIDDIDFTGTVTLAVAATAVNAALAAASLNGVLSAGVTEDGKIILTASGGTAALAYAEPAGAGTDVSALLALTQTAGARKWDAYTPTDLTGEIRNLAAAARVGGFPVFAWALDREYRDTLAQRELADWAEAQNWKAWALLCTNSPAAYNSGDNANIAFYCQNLGYRASTVVYHDNPQQYPEIAFATAILNVNYGLRDSVITACFKDGAGISPVNLTENQLSILDNRRGNTFVRVGNAARTYRYGKQSSPSWFTDSYVGACNFREELQVAVCNALYRNRKLKYDHTGQAVILSAIASICNRYVYNGYLSDRDVLDLTNENGYSTLAAYRLDPTPIYRATDSERANRVLPPIRVTAHEAGAIHHVDIAVDLIN
ncbi:MAG: DUF3383 domain-containing protein [Planctomycetota bacterium]|jgi:hypothetical protein|nr:DUF3383 domain-containing protein [Planctomycetota bacterium]